MEYDTKLVNVEKEETERKHWATVVYKFRMSNGSANTPGDVVLTKGGVNIIEKNRLLRLLRVEFFAPSWAASLGIEVELILQSSDSDHDIEP
jgi:hypothetical protein